MRLRGLAALVLGLSSCITTPSFSPPICPDYDRICLKKDTIHFEALRGFYEASIHLTEGAATPLDHLVLIEATYEIVSPEDAGTTSTTDYTHGYLLDDSGLVLTVAHGVRGYNIYRPSSLLVIDSHHEMYSAHLTDFLDYNLDYALLAVDTGKPPSPHPLHFPRGPSFSPGTPVHLYTFFYKEFPSYLCQSSLDDAPLPLPIYHFMGGQIFSFETLQPQIDDRVVQISLQDPKYGVLDSDLVSFLRDKQRQHGFFPVNYYTRRGYSGAPVFSDSFDFLGMVQSLVPFTYPEDAEPSTFEGITFATPSTPILHALGEYLERHDNRR
jgi:hypothetical protein